MRFMQKKLTYAMGKNVCEYEVAVNNAFRPRTLSWRSFKGSGRGRNHALITEFSLVQMNFELLFFT